MSSDLSLLILSLLLNNVWFFALLNFIFNIIIRIHETFSVPKMSSDLFAFTLQLESRGYRASTRWGWLAEYWRYWLDCSSPLNRAKPSLWRCCCPGRTRKGYYSPFNRYTKILIFFCYTVMDLLARKWILEIETLNFIWFFLLKKKPSLIEIKQYNLWTINPPQSTESKENSGIPILSYPYTH